MSTITDSKEFVQALKRVFLSFDPTTKTSALTENFDDAQTLADNGKFVLEYALVGKVRRTDAKMVPANKED